MGIDENRWQYQQTCLNNDNLCDGESESESATAGLEEEGKERKKSC